MPLLFTENETNNERLFGTLNAGRYVKDGINDYIVDGNRGAVSPEGAGAKVAAHHELEGEPGKTAVLRLRLPDVNPKTMRAPFGDFGRLFEQRRREADEFYDIMTPPSVSADEANVMRQALSGTLWSKRHYFFDAARWLRSTASNYSSRGGRQIRNREWGHMVNNEVISMPDKWEYPWYATWDLASPTIALAGVGVDFAKEQLQLMLQSFYLHPSGQIPAYEWKFSDVNPPVHPRAAIFLYRMEQALRGEGDLDFLKRSFGKLLSNFTWWVNRKDRFGKNVYEGGFLGLDNIGVFDRSAPLPTGGYLEQAGGTAWMGMFCQNMLEIATEIAAYDRTYEDLATTFIDHFLLIARAMNRVGQDGMWDEEDGFYYDVLRLPNGRSTRLKVRSLVGLLPLCATTVVEPWQRERVPRRLGYFRDRLRRVPELLETRHPTGPGSFGYADRGILSPVNPVPPAAHSREDAGRERNSSARRASGRCRAFTGTTRMFRGARAGVGVSYLPASPTPACSAASRNWRGPI